MFSMHVVSRFLLAITREWNFFVIPCTRQLTKRTATKNTEAVVILIFSSENPFNFIHFSMIHFLILNLDFLSIISTKGFSSKTAFCLHLCRLYVHNKIYTWTASTLIWYRWLFYYWRACVFFINRSLRTTLQLSSDKTWLMKYAPMPTIKSSP